MHSRAEHSRIKAILKRATLGGQLTNRDILSLLLTTSPRAIHAMFTAASMVRENHFGNRVFLYGFLYFSTYCRNACRFCYFRSANVEPPRYRKSIEEVLEYVRKLEASGAHLIDLTMGEDPEMHSKRNYDSLLSLVRAVTSETRLSLMISPGVLPKTVIKNLANIGVDWYALYQETCNERLFRRLRLGQNFADRIQTKHNARREGLLIEEGILVGVGETVADWAESIRQMRKIEASQVRAMGFMPQKGTPMEQYPSPSLFDELRLISVMRLVFQDKLIPASYDIDGIRGLQLRLLAGANVVTSLIPCGSDLVGVARSDLDIKDGRRTPEGIRPYLTSIGMTAASKNEYLRWVEAEKANTSRG
jgi:methylornithine synthase